MFIIMKQRGAKLLNACIIIQLLFDKALIETQFKFPISSPLKCSSSSNVGRLMGEGGS